MLKKEKQARLWRKRSLVEDYTFIRKIKPVGLKKDVIDDLLFRHDDNHQITRDEVQATIEMLGKPWVLLKAIKREELVYDVLRIAEDMPEGFDFPGKFPDEVGDLERYITNLIDLRSPAIALELINLIAPNHDFSNIIKRSEETASRLKMNDLSRKIKEVFSSVDFS